MSKAVHNGLVSHIGGWLSSERNPRWILVLGAAFTIILPMGFEYWKDRQAQGRQQIEEAITSFELGALDIQGFAGTYVTSILDNMKDVDDKRTQLSQIIARQHGAIDLAERLFDAQTASSAVEYQSALSELQEILPEVRQILDMGPFWEANVRVLLARDKFLDELRSQES